MSVDAFARLYALQPPSTNCSLTHLVAADLVGRMAGGINLINAIEAVVLKRHLHEVCLHKVAARADAVACLLVVVHAAANLVCVVVQACGAGMVAGWALGRRVHGG